MSDLHSSIRRSSKWMIVRLGISLTVGAFVTSYIVRSLTVRDYGVYAVLYSLIGYVSVIGSFGIPSVFQRFIPEALQKREYSLLKCLVLRGLILRILLSAVTVGIILLFHGPVGRVLKVEGFLGYFTILACGIVLSLEARLLASVLHSLFLHKYSVIAGTVYTISRGVWVFILLRMHWGIRGVLCAEALSWGVWTLLLWHFYRAKFARQHPDNERTSFPLGRYLRYGGLSSLNELGNSVLGVSTDFFVITAFLGPGAVALYAFADRVVKLFMNCMPQQVLIDVIRPTFFTKHADSGDVCHLVDMFNFMLKIGAFCIFPLVAGIFVLGDKMVAIIFTADYLPGLPILWVLVTFAAINIFAMPTGLVLQGIERVEINLYSKIFAVYNLIAELIVVQWFGVMGVVLVTCSAVLMKNIFSYYFVKKYIAMSVDWRSLRVIVTNASIMAMVLWPLRVFVVDFLSLSLVSCLGIVTYSLSAWLNKAFSSRERDWINRIAPHPVFVF